MKPKIWMSSPHMSGYERKFIDEAFETNWIAPLGPNVTGFENDITQYLNEKDKYVAVLSSGTAAIHLGLILLEVGCGDEVICQSKTFSASANPIVYQGATPVFIDSEKETWNLCPEQLEKAIKDRISKGKKPKAIIAVHLYGMPYKVKEVHSIAENYNIPVLEDSAEAFGSSYLGKKCGSFGDISILSFNGNKIITTSGGGAIITRSKELREKAIFLSTQARDKAVEYHHSHIGYNYRMSNVVAGIGRGQMKVLDKHVALRRKVYNFYEDFFSSIKSTSVLKEPKGHFSNRWLSTLLLDSLKTREELRMLFDSENIETRPLWKPMHKQPIFKNAPSYLNGVSDDLFNRGLCLPSGSNMTQENMERIEKVLQKFFK